jgi:hypothetical protein
MAYYNQGYYYSQPAPQAIMPRWEEIAPLLPLYLLLVLCVSVLFLCARVWWWIIKAYLRLVFRIVRYLFFALPWWLHLVCMYLSVAFVLRFAEQRNARPTWY